ncbi:MAG TPA: alpha/beta fold hydrolase [Vicinamibacteria bacterium]|nr:alpha/beta fold hydrolase [Vicinamibacteria bacterium]
MRAKIAGAEIAYEARGQGPAVLLFHAFPLGLFMWDAQAEALAASHRVIRFDARGFGATPPGDALLTMERIADDGAALLDHLGVSQAVVGGCSMGGYAAFAFVRRHADRLKGLVLQDTRAGADGEEARRSRAALAEKVRKEGAGAAAEAFLPKLVGETTHRERPELVARLRERILATSARGIADALAGLASRADSTSTLREVRVPTLVVCGAEDVLTPVAESEAIQKAVAGSRLEVIPRAGHLANLENPAAYGAALRSFLDRIPARR